jgi:hypothetical protein
VSREFTSNQGCGAPKCGSSGQLETRGVWVLDGAEQLHASAASDSTSSRNDPSLTSGCKRPGDRRSVPRRGRRLAASQGISTPSSRRTPTHRGAVFRAGSHFRRPRAPRPPGGNYGTDRSIRPKTVVFEMAQKQYCAQDTRSSRFPRIARSRTCENARDSVVDFGRRGSPIG